MIKAEPIIIRELKSVAIATGIGIILMWIVFFVLHLLFKDSVSFDYTVFSGGVCGGAIAVLNFFLMGLSIQKVTDLADNKTALSSMRKSYLWRTVLQMGWVVIAILAPCFQYVAGIVPLFFPSIFIKLGGCNKNTKVGGEL